MQPRRLTRARENVPRKHSYKRFPDSRRVDRRAARKVLLLDWDPAGPGTGRRSGEKEIEHGMVATRCRIG